MAIKKRSKIDPSVTKASERNEQPHDARSEVLQGLHLDVYRFIRNNPNCTRDDVSRGLKIKSSTVTARIKELIDDGFIMEPPGMRRANPSGVSAKCLHVTVRPHGGRKLDRVRIEVELRIDSDGNYYADAHVVGGCSPVSRTQDVKRQRITITAPHPDTYKGLQSTATVERITRAEIEAHAGDIIDVDGYPVIDD